MITQTPLAGEGGNNSVFSLYLFWNQKSKKVSRYASMRQSY